MLIEAQTKWDTLVIGAGAAGLNAARILSQNHQKVLVLEARSRVGGRIWSLIPHPQSEPVELGAEFVHGVPNELNELLEPSSDLYQRGGEYFIARDGKLSVEEDYFKKIQSILSQLSPTLQEDCSFSQFVSQKCSHVLADAIELVKNYVEGYHAADAAQISALALATIEKESEEVDAVSGALFLKGGQHALVNRLVSSINSPLLLEHVVTQVKWSPGEVDVHAISLKENRRPLIFKARTLLTTVPLGVLQAPPNELGFVRFDPELPRWKKEAISLMKMGKAIRITYQFSRSFWDERRSRPEVAMIFDTSSQASLRVWWPRGNLLMGWIGGPQSEAWTDLSEENLRREGVKSLSRIFGLTGEYIDSLLEKCYTHDWSSDPFSKGVYSYIGINGSSAPGRLAEPIENTLFFAGEATQAGGYIGTVNGALISGQKAAIQIIKRLTPS